LSERCLILRRNEPRFIIISCQTVTKYAFSRQFFFPKNPRLSHFMKIRPVGV
jgi:hypothetical protein